jgi:transcriptional regulator
MAASLYLLRHSLKDTNAAKMLQKKYLSNSSLNQKVFALLSLLVHYTGLFNIRSPFQNIHNKHKLQDSFLFDFSCMQQKRMILFFKRRFKEYTKTY